MFRPIHILIYFNIIVLQACSKGYESTYKNYDITRQISIDVPTGFIDFSSCLRIDAYDFSRLWFQPLGQKDIHIFDLVQQKYEGKINLSGNSPSAIPSDGRGFLQLSPDTIMLAAKGAKSLFLANLDGQIIERIHLDEIMSGIIRGINTLSDNPIIINENEWIFFHNFPDGLYQASEKSKEVQRHHILKVYNRNTNTLTGEEVLMPSDFFEIDLEKSVSMLMAHVPKYNFAFLTFLYSNEIIKVALEDFSSITKDIIATHYRDYMSVRIHSLDFISDRALRAKNEILLNDPFRDLLYRVEKHDQFDHYDPNANYTIDDIDYMSPFSITILNYDLVVVGEIFIDDQKKYVARNTFVGPDGIYLSKNNPYHNDYQEDKFEFDVINFR